MILIPLIAAVASLVMFVVVKRRPAKISLLVLGLASGALGVILNASTISYLWAGVLEVRWSKADPKTRREMESYLSLYRISEINPFESSWGKLHVMRDGDRMLRYVILWDAPLDVVYDRDDRVQAIYTSYE